MEHYGTLWNSGRDVWVDGPGRGPVAVDRAVPGDPCREAGDAHPVRTASPVVDNHLGSSQPSI